MIMKNPIQRNSVPAALLVLLVSGCGTVSNLTSAAQQAANANGSQSANSSSGSSSGGSLSLTEPTTTSSSDVAKIRVAVLNPAACATQGAGGFGGGGDPHHRGHGGGWGGPGGGFGGHGGGWGGPGGWGGQGGFPGQPQIVEVPPPANSSGSTSLALDTSTSTGTIDITTTQGTGTIAAPASPDANKCIVANSEQAYQAGSTFTINSIPAGDYTVEVILADASENSLEEGTASVTITAGATATANVTLTPVATTNGSVAVTVSTGTGAAVELAITSAALNQSGSACGALSIASADANGVASDVANALTLSLTSNSSTGKFYSDSACTTAITTVPLAAASDAVTVYYMDSTAGSPLITVADTATTGALTSATQTETIN